MAHRPTRPLAAARLRAAVPGNLRGAVPTRLRSAVPTRPRVLAPHPAPPQGPHIRLGLAWAAMTSFAAAAGPVALAVLFTPLAALAAAQGARSWRRRQRRPSVPVSAGGAAAVASAALFGVLAVAVAALAAAALLAIARFTVQPQRHASPALTGLLAVGCGLAAAAPVLLRSDGFIPVFVLLTFIHVYDASAYVVGAGAAASWEGPAAGAASIFAVTLAVAAVLSPPFRGASPWLFGLLAAVLIPLGPIAARELTGNPRARVPALRRLDSLLVVGPLWALAASLVLD